MNYRAIFAIVRKDLKVASQNKGVMVPIIVLIIVFFVLLPWLTRLLPLVENMAGDSLDDIAKLLSRMPGGLQQDFSGLSLTQTMTVYALQYMLAPMFLMLPMMCASVSAAKIFAVARVRKTRDV